MGNLSFDYIRSVNQELRGKSADDIIAWAFKQGGDKTVTSTSFGDHSAALLHMVTHATPDAQVLWIDTGYNTSATYRYADSLTRRLNLNIDVYAPEMTSVRRNVLMGGIPPVDSPLHEEFTRQVKLEPFQRALRVLQPNVWISGIRKEQTDYRKNLDVVSLSKQGYLKVAPLFDWSEDELGQYLLEHGLPNEPDYFDPTKVAESRECGLHTSL